MYTCDLCNKEFKYESKLIQHNNRKKSCNGCKNEYICKLCNVDFVRPAEQLRHEKTIKHIKKLKQSYNLDKIKSEESNLNKYLDLENKYNKLLKENDILKINEQSNLNKYLDLETKYNLLQNQFKILKENCNKNLDYHEQIYIIHERTFVELNANIYKIGKTKNIKNRLNGYAKGSKLLFSIACKDCTESENKILNYLKNNDKYIQVKEYGKEYFQCDLKDLISEIYNLIL
jgi:hypothetical protein